MTPIDRIRALRDTLATLRRGDRNAAHGFLTKAEVILQGLFGTDCPPLADIRAAYNTLIYEPAAPGPFDDPRFIDQTDYWQEGLGQLQNHFDAMILSIEEFGVQSLRRAGPSLTSPDEAVIEQCIALASRCTPEPGATPPKVGAVLVREGRVLAEAYRGELSPGDHAEFTLLEKKLPNSIVADSVLYTTLEPCTTRNHPKLPCAERIIERKIRCVVIGMLDPNPNITGRGQRRLSEAGIETILFPHRFVVQVEEQNREFTRIQRGRTAPSRAGATPSEAVVTFDRLPEPQQVLLDAFKVQSGPTIVWARHLKLSAQEAQFHLESLETLGLIEVYRARAGGRPFPSWRLSRKGRQFLFEPNLGA